jgi:hypothetical protein
LNGHIGKENFVEGKNEGPAQQTAQRLKTLEYAVRSSIYVREEQEDDAEPDHLKEAAQCGIEVNARMTKGDLLNAVQTILRACAK